MKTGMNYDKDKEFIFLRRNMKKFLLTTKYELRVVNDKAAPNRGYLLVHDS